MVAVASGAGRPRWHIALMLLGPILAQSVYLLWIWPRPHGSGFIREVGPYLASLAFGLPFVLWIVRGAAQRIVASVVYVVVGFWVLFFFSMAVLCGVRGECL
jgi:hypothetical protein